MLSSYHDETIKVNPIASLGDRVETTVRTIVVQGQGKQPVPIDYSMEKKPDGWKVYDVTVGGVSLVTNYRGSFNSQVRKGGVEGLLKTLSDKNKSLEGTAAEDYRFIKFTPASLYNDGDGHVNITYSSEADVSLAVVAA